MVLDWFWSDFVLVWYGSGVLGGFRLVLCTLLVLVSIKLFLFWTFTAQHCVAAKDGTA